jgi:hypothetical protein
MATRKTRRTRRAVSRTKPVRRTAKRGGSQWTREEIAFLRKNYRKNETKWVARQLGRTVYSVRYKASDLNIKKAAPSVWKGNTGNKKTSRPMTTRKQKSNRRSTRTRWAKTTRRITRKASARRPKRRTRR